MKGTVKRNRESAEGNENPFAKGFWVTKEICAAPLEHRELGTNRASPLELCLSRADLELRRAATLEHRELGTNRAYQLHLMMEQLAVNAFALSTKTSL